MSTRGVPGGGPGTEDEGSWPSGLAYSRDDSDCCWPRRVAMPTLQTRIPSDAAPAPPRVRSGARCDQCEVRKGEWFFGSERTGIRPGGEL